jgi:hypothetical protein
MRSIGQPLTRLWSFNRDPIGRSRSPEPDALVGEPEDNPCIRILTATALRHAGLPPLHTSTAAS